MNQETPQPVTADDEPRELSFDEAEAAGLDGTGRDGDARFPYTTEHL